MAAILKITDHIAQASAPFEQTALSSTPGQVLSTRYESKLRELTKIDYGNPAACPACPLRSRCTTDQRRVSRLENKAVLDRMAARLKARPKILAQDAGCDDAIVARMVQSGQ